MTVKELIKQLKKMPQDLDVGVACGDNAEFEVSDWPRAVDHHVKSDFDPDSDEGADKNMIADQPDEWVTIHC